MVSPVPAFHNDAVTGQQRKCRQPRTNADAVSSSAAARRTYAVDVAGSGTAWHPTSIRTTLQNPVMSPMSSRGIVQTAHTCGGTALQLCPAKHAVLHLGLQPQHHTHQRSTCRTCACRPSAWRLCCRVVLDQQATRQVWEYTEALLTATVHQGTPPHK